MPLVDGTFVVPTRADVVDQVKKNIRIRIPDAEVGEGTFFEKEARVEADTLAPIYSDAAKAGNGIPLKNRTHQGLVDELEDMGLAAPLEADGARGYVLVGASVGGAAMAAGQELTFEALSLTYQVVNSATYNNGDPCAIVGKDTGPSTNLAAGAILKWSSPPPGINDTCTVIEQADGSGLSGGRGAETDEQIVNRIRTARAKPAASGNDAEIQQEIVKTPNVPIEATFTHPAIKGPGTTSYVFTLQPDKVGGSRVPTGAHMTAVATQLLLKFPKDFGLLAASLLTENVDVALRVQWTPAATAWSEIAPWPSYVASARVTVNASPTPTPTAFRLTDSSSTLAAPTPGITIGIWDPVGRVFSRKRVLSVATISTYVWDIVCDISNGITDTIYTPVSGDWVSPWSDSLAPTALAVLGHFDTLGPGEQTALLYDQGYRVKRNPPVETEWISELDERMTNPLFDTGLLARVQIKEPTLPVVPHYGGPGIASYLLVLNKLAVFPT